MKINTTRATALAAANAVVVHLGIGLFISRCTIDDAIQEDHKRGRSGIVRIVGHTNTGRLLVMSNTIVFKEDADSDSFPVKQVFVCLHDQSGHGNAGDRTYFEYVPTNTTILVKSLDSDPNEITGAEEFARHAARVKEVWTRGEGRGFHET